MNYLILPMVLNSGTSLSTITSAITEIVTAAISWVTSWATVIVSTPLLLFFVVMTVVGMGVGFIMRIIHRR